MPRKCPNKSNKNCRNERNQCQQKKKYGCPQNYTGARNVCNNKLLCTEGNTRYTNLKMDAGNCGCKCQYDIPPVPNGPPDDGNLWDLQFCRWWGWNWVRKQEELQNQQRCMRKSPVYSPCEPCGQRPKPNKLKDFCKKCKNYCSNFKKKSCAEKCFKDSLQQRFNTPCSSVIIDECKCDKPTVKKKIVVESSVSKIHLRKDDACRRKKYKMNVSKIQSWVKEKQSSSSSEEACCRVSVDRICETSTEESIEYISRRIENICEESETSSSSESCCACSDTKVQPTVIKVCCCCNNNNKNEKKEKCECKNTQTEVQTQDKQIQGCCKCKKKKRKRCKCNCKPQEKLLIVCNRCNCTDGSQEESNTRKKCDDKTCQTKTKPARKETEPEENINQYSALVDKEQYKSPFTGHLYDFNIPKISFPQIKYHSSKQFPKPLDKSDNIDIVTIQALDSGDDEHKKLLTAVCEAIFASRETPLNNYDYESNTFSKTQSSVQEGSTVSTSDKSRRKKGARESPVKNYVYDAGMSSKTLASIREMSAISENDVKDRRPLASTAPDENNGATKALREVPVNYETDTSSKIQPSIQEVSTVSINDKSRRKKVLRESPGNSSIYDAGVSSKNAAAILGMSTISENNVNDRRPLASTAPDDNNEATKTLREVPVNYETDTSSKTQPSLQEVSTVPTCDKSRIKKALRESLVKNSIYDVGMSSKTAAPILEMPTISENNVNDRRPLASTAPDDQNEATKTLTEVPENYETDTSSKTQHSAQEVSTVPTDVSEKSVNTAAIELVDENIGGDVLTPIQKLKHAKNNKGSLLPLRSPRNSKRNYELPQVTCTGLYTTVPDGTTEKIHKHESQITRNDIFDNKTHSVDKVASCKLEEFSVYVKKTDVYTSDSFNVQLPKIVEETQTVNAVNVEEKSCGIIDTPNILKDITKSLVNILNNQTLFQPFATQFPSDAMIKTNYVTKSDTEQLLTSLSFDQSRNNPQSDIIQRINDAMKTVTPFDSEEEICCIEINPPDLKYIANNIEFLKTSISDDGRIAQLLQGKESVKRTTTSSKNELLNENNANGPKISASASYAMKYQEAINKEKLKRSYFNTVKRKEQPPQSDSDTADEQIINRPPHKSSLNRNFIKRIRTKSKIDGKK